MANKLIDELIIKIKHRGAAQTEKAIHRIADGLEDAAAGANLLQEELDKLPSMLKEIEGRATSVSKAFKNMPQSFGDRAILGSLERIAKASEDTHEEIIDLNDTILKASASNSKAIDGMTNHIVEGLDRVQDGMTDATAATKKLGKQTAKTKRNMEGIGKGSTKASTGLSAMDRQGRNNTRTFAAMAKIAGPLPLLYAQIASNVFVLSEAFRVLSEGEQINRLEQIGAVMGAKVGIPIQTVAMRMQELTGNTLSYAESLRQAAAVSAYGFDSTQIEQLTMAARRASLALGVDMTDALNRVVKGTSKLEIELLDELGITTKLTTAYTNYAQTLGVSADSLNSYQQRAALVNEINKQSVEKFGELDSIIGGMPWEKFGANAKTAMDELLANISESTSGIAEALNNMLSVKAERTKGIKQVTSTVATFQQALKTGNIGGQIVATQELIRLDDELLAKRTELNAKLKEWRTLSGSDAGKLAEDLKATNEALRRMSVIPTAGFFNVPNLEEAAKAYQGITAAVKGSVADFKKSITALSTSNTSYDKLYNSINSTTKAYDNLKKANPAATAKELSTQLKLLGFDSEKSLEDTKELVSMYYSASKGLEDYAINTAKANRAASESGAEISIGLLKERLKLEDKAWVSAKLLGAQGKELNKLNLARYKTMSDLTKAEVALVDKRTARYNATNAIIVQEGKLGAIGAKRAELGLEQARLKDLKSIKGTYELQVDSLLKIKALTAEIGSMESARARTQQGAYYSALTPTTGLDPETKQGIEAQQQAEMFAGAMSNITSQVDGLGAMTSAFQDLTLAAAGFGETSLTALQATSIGLNGFAGMLKMTANASISSIDAQIQQEQKRDGKSKESLAKIKALEAKKIQEQKKSAQQQILISTAVAVMNAASNPWPVPALPLMGAAALAGSIAYAQASTAASNQMATLNTEPNIPTASVSLGNRQKDIDVSKSASAGELAFLRGQQGTGGAQNFTPRANGGNMTPNTSYIVGENGAEVITPTNPMKSYSAEDSSDTGSRGRAIELNLHVNALDSQSVMDRSSDIAAAVRYDLEQQGINLDNLR